MKNFLFLILVGLLASCSQKMLLKGSTAYKAKTGNGPNPTAGYQRYKVNKSTPIKMLDNGTYVIIHPVNKWNTDDFTAQPNSTTWFPFSDASFIKWEDWKTADTSAGYFPEEQDSFKATFWYQDGKVILQGASIPLKIRPKIRKPELGDSIPSTTETGFNVGFLAGYKFSWNKVNKKQNIFGNQTNAVSVTPGALLSIGAADLSTSSTRPAIAFARKSPMVTIGGACVIGFNRINFGYALGFDYALGPYSSSWLYQGKMWNGLIVSLDLIK